MPSWPTRRLTSPFSWKRDNKLQAALALHFTAYNFNWMFRLRDGGGIAREALVVRDLLVA